MQQKYYILDVLTTCSVVLLNSNKFSFHGHKLPAITAYSQLGVTTSCHISAIHHFTGTNIENTLNCLMMARNTTKNTIYHNL